MVDAGGQHAVLLARDPNIALKCDTKPPEVKFEASAPKDAADTVVPTTNRELNGSNATADCGSPSKPIVIEPPPPASIEISSEVVSTAGATVNSSSLHSCSLVAGSDQSSLSSNCGSYFTQPLSDQPAKPAALTTALAPESASTSELGCPLTDGGSVTDGDTKSQQ